MLERLISISFRYVSFLCLCEAYTHTHTDRGMCVCVVCANKVGQGMTACVKEREGEREGAYAVRIVMENCCHVGVGLQQQKQQQQQRGTPTVRVYNNESLRIGSKRL